LDIVNLMISKGATNWNWGVNGACKGGLKDACKGEHLEIIHLMISKGAKINKLHSYTLYKYKNYIRNKDLIRKIEYNRDLLEEILQY
jgi:hypothetical protein